VYVYRAKILRVVDGDTVDADIDLGCFVHRESRLRLYGVNTPELHDPDAATRARAVQARDWMRGKVEGRDVIVRTHLDRSDKYGRLLAEIFMDGDGVTGTTVNSALVSEGLAVPYMVDKS
jgi:micrococcal nuclease